MAAPVSSAEEEFIVGVSASTGVDPRVLQAWAQSEGNPGDMYNNYLNIAYPTAASVGVPASGIAAGNTAEFQTIQQGIAATTKEINNLGLGGLAGQTPQQQISEIAASPWASSHYGGAGGPNLVATFNSLFPGQLGSVYSGKPSLSPSQAAAIGAAANDQYPGQPEVASAQGTLSSIESGLSSATSSIGSGVSFLTSWRFAEIVGGVILLVIGLVVTAKSLGFSPPGAGAVSVASKVAPL